MSTTLDPLPKEPPPAAATRFVNVNTTNVNSVGVFTTGQSLVTFSGAVAAVTTIWNVLATSPRFRKDVKAVPLALSLLIVLFIYVLSSTNSSTWREKLESFGIALINSFTIAAAAMGIGLK